MLGFNLHNVYHSTSSLTCPYPLNILGYKKLEIILCTQGLQTNNYSSLLCIIRSAILGINNLQHIYRYKTHNTEYSIRQYRYRN